MKREMLKGIWEDAAEKFENSFAPDILGYWYSRYCGGEMIDLKEVLLRNNLIISAFRANMCTTKRKTKETEVHR